MRECYECHKEIDPNGSYGRFDTPEKRYYLCAECVEKIFTRVKGDTIKINNLVT